MEALNTRPPDYNTSDLNHSAKLPPINALRINAYLCCILYSPCSPCHMDMKIFKDYQWYFYILFYYVQLRTQEGFDTPEKVFTTHLFQTSNLVTQIGFWETRGTLCQPSIS